MRVFVTGASGHIGSALIPELLAAGHQVVGLARSDAAAAAVAERGAEAHRGDATDPDSFLDAVAAADGVVHLAYDHSFTDMAAAAAADLRTVRAIGERLAGTGKPLVATSGTLLLAFGSDGALGFEHDTRPGGSRIDVENAVVAMAAEGVRGSVVRLAPLVHSDLDHHGFAPIMIRIAREKGVAAYVGDGTNRWPAVNTRDAARLYRLALESAPGGTRLHAVEGEGVPLRTIAETIAQRLGIPAVSIEPEQADEHFGFLGPLVQLDNPTSAEATRKLLDWKPEHPDLIADLEAGHYFRTQD
ncbi:MAG: SDR family oxidoreductase [Catenulispora sp.]|nr:SDR family oxidoreductase [Catenulispora sp.]